MTFSLVSFCPWNAGGNANSLIFLSDCRLTKLLPGSRLGDVASDSEPKIFELGPYAVASYAGNQISAGFALRRVAPLFQKPKRQPGFERMFSRVAKAMHDGKRQAQRYARRKGQRFVGGSFIMLLGYVDSSNRLNMGMLGGGERTDTFFFAGIRVYEDVRALIVGSGAQSESVSHFMSHIEDLFMGTDLATTLKEREPVEQASYLARGLARLLKVDAPEGCGGGVQMVTLDTQNGTASWRLWSTPGDGFALIPEGKWAPSDWEPQPDWTPERPDQLKLFRKNSFPDELPLPGLEASVWGSDKGGTSP